MQKWCINVMLTKTFSRLRCKIIILALGVHRTSQIEIRPKPSLCRTGQNEIRPNPDIWLLWSKNVSIILTKILKFLQKFIFGREKIENEIWKGSEEIRHRCYGLAEPFGFVHCRFGSAESWFSPNYGNKIRSNRIVWPNL